MSSSHGDAPAISLAPESRPFVLWHADDVPAEWRQAPCRAQLAEASKQLVIPMAELERYTALEFPDVGGGCEYYAWTSEKL